MKSILKLVVVTVIVILVLLRQDELLDEFQQLLKNKSLESDALLSEAIQVANEVLPPLYYIIVILALYTLNL